MFKFLFILKFDFYIFCRTKKRGGNTEEVLRKRSIPSKLPSSDMLDIINSSSNIAYSKVDYARFKNVSTFKFMSQ